MFYAKFIETWQKANEGVQSHDVYLTPEASSKAVFCINSCCCATCRAEFKVKSLSDHYTNIKATLVITSKTGREIAVCMKREKKRKACKSLLEQETKKNISPLRDIFQNSIQK